MRISLLILACIIAIMAMAVQADKKRPSEPAEALEKVKTKLKGLRKSPVAQSRVQAKKLISKPQQPSRQSRVIKPLQTVVKQRVHHPLRAQRRQKKVQAKQQARQRKNSNENRFRNFLKNFARLSKRPAFVPNRRPVVDNRRRDQLVGKAHPIVNTKAEDILGYEKFTLDEVVLPKSNDLIQERSDDITVLIEETKPEDDIKEVKPVLDER